LARNDYRERPWSGDAQEALFDALYSANRMAEAGSFVSGLWASWRLEVGDLAPEKLLQIADSARASGRPDLAAEMRSAAQELAGQYEKMGAPRYLNAYRAFLATYDRRDEEAMALLSKAAPTHLFARPELENPFFARLLPRPDFQALLKQLDARRAVERAKVAAVLCDPKMATATWKPLPSTCAQPTAAK